MKLVRGGICDLAHIIYLPLNILSPVPKDSDVELFKIFLLNDYNVCSACEELRPNEKCSTFGGGGGILSM